MVIVLIDDTKLETLKFRINRGLEFCNSTWQRYLAESDPVQLERLSKLLDSSASRLHSLIYVADLYGLDSCVFGECKCSDSFLCFGCPKKESEVS